jgi:acetyltransferase
MSESSELASSTQNQLKLHKFFHPKSIAVLGASVNETSFGNRYLNALLQFGYKGSLYPVNQSGDSVLGLKAYSRVLDIPDQVDLAVISVPSRSVADLLKDCVKKNIDSAIVLSSGFSEIGEQGRILEQGLSEVARQGIRIMGPNCFGVYCPSGEITIIPGVRYPKTVGGVSFFTQSGQFSELVIGRSIGEGIKFSKVVSYGNACDLNEADLVEYLAMDEETKVIEAYIEGVKNGRRLFELVRQYSSVKPILIWKVALTEAGSKAASSHTGSMAGSNTVWDTFFQQTNVNRINSVEELIDTSIAFTCYPEGCGSRVALISGGGGGSVVTADAMEEVGLKVVTFAEATREKLASLLPGIGTSVNNPVDMGPPLQPVNMLTSVLEAIAADDNVDAIIVRRIFLSVKAAIILSGSHPVPESEQQALMEIPVKIKDKYGKPVIIIITEENASQETLEVEAERRKLRDYYIANGIPVYVNEKRTAAAIAHLAKFKRIRAQRTTFEKTETAETDKVNIKHRTLGYQRIIGNFGSTLNEIESKSLLKQAGVDVTDTFLARSKKEALVLCEKLGFPVAMKIMSPQIIHKTDVGGVKLGLKTTQEVDRAYDEIITNIMIKSPKSEIQGVSMQKMAPAGIELVIGMTKDRQFGPMLMFGLGGTYVEIIKDVAFRIVPIIYNDAQEMIRQIKGYRLIRGFRGQPPVNEEKLQDLLIKISEFIQCHPEIKEMDINPIMASGSEIIACDARIILENE